MFHVIIIKENANHKEILPHTHQNGYTNNLKNGIQGWAFGTVVKDPAGGTLIQTGVPGFQS